MNHNFIQPLRHILQFLHQDANIDLPDQALFEIAGNCILTPVGDICPLLNSLKSPLRDQMIQPALFRKLIRLLNIHKSIVRLNHVGFCYRVSSQQEEKNRLIKLVRNTGFHAYEEQSGDETVWLFIGNSKEWEKPMLEFVLVEKTSDRWVNYWLPHIQIDIDSTLSEKQIIEYAKTIFGNLITPFPIIINGTVYIIRLRLGSANGINIDLDIATNKRNVRYLRQHLFKQLI